MAIKLPKAPDVEGITLPYSVVGSIVGRGSPYAGGVIGAAGADAALEAVREYQRQVEAAIKAAQEEARKKAEEARKQAEDAAKAATDQAKSQVDDELERAKQEAEEAEQRAQEAAQQARDNASEEASRAADEARKAADAAAGRLKEIQDRRIESQRQAQAAAQAPQDQGAYGGSPYGEGPTPQEQQQQAELLARSQKENPNDVLAQQQAQQGATGVAGAIPGQGLTPGVNKPIPYYPPYVPSPFPEAGQGDLATRVARQTVGLPSGGGEQTAAGDAAAGALSDRTVDARSVALGALSRQGALPNPDELAGMTVDQQRGAFNLGPAAQFARLNADQVPLAPPEPNTQAVQGMTFDQQRAAFNLGPAADFARLNAEGVAPPQAIQHMARTPGELPAAQQPITTPQGVFDAAKRLAGANQAGPGGQQQPGLIQRVTGAAGYPQTTVPSNGQTDTRLAGAGSVSWAPSNAQTDTRLAAPGQPAQNPATAQRLAGFDQTILPLLRNMGWNDSQMADVRERIAAGEQINWEAARPEQYGVGGTLYQGQNGAQQLSGALKARDPRLAPVARPGYNDQGVFEGDLPAGSRSLNLNPDNPGEEFGQNNMSVPVYRPDQQANWQPRAIPNAEPTLNPAELVMTAQALRTAPAAANPPGAIPQGPIGLSGMAPEQAAAEAWRRLTGASADQQPPPDFVASWVGRLQNGERDPFLDAYRQANPRQAAAANRPGANLVGLTPVEAARQAWLTQTGGQQGGTPPEDYIRSWLGAWQNGEQVALAGEYNRLNPGARESYGPNPGYAGVFSPEAVATSARAFERQGMLSYGDAIRASGSAAVLGFARAFGRPPTPAEADRLTAEIGQWAQQRGLVDARTGAISPEAEVQLLQHLGIPARAEAFSPDTLRQAVTNGSPVILNLPGRAAVTVYGVSQDGQTFLVGGTGTSGPTMAADEIQRLAGQQASMIVAEQQRRGPAGLAATGSRGGVLPGREPYAIWQPNHRQPADPQADAATVEAYIRRSAAARGIDPDVAVTVAMHEGGTGTATRGTFATGSSWWPFQLHYGGAGYEHFGTTAGKGNDFTRDTGWQPGDPSAWADSIDYALDEVGRKGWGQWYGARAAGIGNWQGITPRGARQ